MTTDNSQIVNGISFHVLQLTNRQYRINFIFIAEILKNETNDSYHRMQLFTLMHVETFGKESDRMSVCQFFKITVAYLSSFGWHLKYD